MRRENKEHCQKRSVKIDHGKDALSSVFSPIFTRLVTLFNVTLKGKAIVALMERGLTKNMKK